MTPFSGLPVRTVLGNSALVSKDCIAKIGFHVLPGPIYARFLVCCGKELSGNPRFHLGERFEDFASGGSCYIVNTTGLKNVLTGYIAIFWSTSCPICERFRAFNVLNSLWFLFLGCIPNSAIFFIVRWTLLNCLNISSVDMPWAIFLTILFFSANVISNNVSC